jgi:hypothetical protein
MAKQQLVQGKALETITDEVTFFIFIYTLFFII